MKADPARHSLSKAMHELGHAIEHQIKGMLDKTKKFLRSRLRQNEKPVRLQKIFPNEGFGKSEWLIEDRWAYLGGDKYTGRFYLDEDGEICGTEILTVGLERLHADPIDFYHRDPDFFRFIVTTLRFPQ